MKSTTTEHAELLRSQMSVNEQSKENSSNKPLFEQEKIEGTPFVVVTWENGQSVVRMGKFQMNEEQLNGLGEAMLWIENNQFNLMAKIAMIVFNDLVEQGLRNTQKDVMKKAPTTEHNHE